MKFKRLVPLALALAIASTTAAGGADPRRRTANQLFAHAPERRILLYRADRGRRFLRACR